MNEYVASQPDLLLNYVLKQIFGRNTVCTYIYNHNNLISASLAVMNCSMIIHWTQLHWYTGSNFSPRNLDYISGRALVSLTSIRDIIGSGMRSTDMLVAVNDLASAMQWNEHGKNDLMEQVLERKLGIDFLVTCKALTRCKGMSISLYSRSNQIFQCSTNISVTKVVRWH